MIDRATTGKAREVRSGDMEVETKRPPLARYLRDRASSAGGRAAERRQQRAQTIGSVLKSTVSILLLIWVVLAVLSTLGVNIAPFIASAGVVGLAIGFGAQNLVKDFVTGEVQSVGLRITTLRDIDGILWYVRNGEISRVGNMSQDFAVARVEVPVALTADVDRAEQVALDAAHEAIADPTMAAKVVGEPEMLGVQELSADLLKLRMTVKTKPNAQWSVQRRLRRAVLRAYDEHGIDLPYPQGRIAR